MVRLTKEDIDEIEAIMEGSYVHPPKASFDLRHDALHGGIVGLILPIDRFELAPGLRLVSTYAHVMAPLVMAFAPPPRKTAPHPGPWAALHDRGLDITSEVQLLAAANPLGFDRLNTLWFVIALLRLRLAQPLQMPVLADRPFSAVPDNVKEANLIPVEIQLGRPIIGPQHAATADDLKWLSQNIVPAHRMMTNHIFNRAFQTLDQAVAIVNPGAGIVIAWAAIELLFRPGARQITNRISRALAAYLHPPSPERDRALTNIMKSYEARGGAAHAGKTPEAREFQTAFQLARSSLIMAIQLGELPDIEVLIEKWRSRT